MKLKSKKMSKSTFAVILMAIAMIAMLAFGGTYALFTANAAAATSSEVTTGTVKLDAGATATLAVTYATEPGADDAELLLPGDTVTLTTNIANNSTVKVYVFAKINIDDTIGLFTDYTPDGWTALEGEDKVYWTTLAAEGEGTRTAGFTAEIEYDPSTGNVSNGATAGTAMGQTTTITARFAAVQVKNTTLATAYAAVADLITVA